MSTMKKFRKQLPAAITALGLIFSIVPAMAQSAPTTNTSVPASVSTLPGVAFSPTLAAMLPQDVRDAGALTIATTAYTPPITFFGPDNKEIIGVNADLMAALGIMFGVKVQLTDLGAFSALIPSIKARRFNISISGFFDNADLEKQVDVLSYMQDGKTILVLKGNPQGIHSMADLCGKKVSVAVGTPTETMVMDQSKKCPVPIDILSIPKNPDVLAAVRSGRVDATVNGYATSVYATAHQMQAGVGLEALPDVRLDPGNLGMLFNKSDTQLRDAVQAALQQLMQSGADRAIMKKWGLENLTIYKATINSAATQPAS
jgi:polar amino acid transport system substrate-binding protein